MARQGMRHDRHCCVHCVRQMMHCTRAGSPLRQRNAAVTCRSERNLHIIHIRSHNTKIKAANSKMCKLPGPARGRLRNIGCTELNARMGELCGPASIVVVPGCPTRFRHRILYACGALRARANADDATLRTRGMHSKYYYPFARAYLRQSAAKKMLFTNQRDEHTQKKTRSQRAHTITRIVRRKQKCDDI